MALVPMKYILDPARAGGYGVAAFEFWSLDSAQAIIAAGEAAGMPVILQAGPLEAAYAGGCGALALIARHAAAGAKVPAALHLDHAETMDLVEAALAAGFTSVMIDASAMPFSENAEITRRAVAAAKPFGATVEAELGRLAGSEAGFSASQEEALQTDPAEAARFAAETGIDALAVAIGTAHGAYTLAPKINLARLAEIARAVSIPLILHGGSGTPDEAVEGAIALGVAKVNICTEFIAAYAGAAQTAQAREGFRHSVPSYFEPQRAAGQALALSKIRLFARGRRVT